MFLTKASLAIVLSLPVTVFSRKLHKHSSPDPSPTPTSQAQAVLTGSVRVVEVKTMDGGDIFFGLATNFLTQQQSIVGGQLITTATVFRPEDVVVEDGAIVGDIDFKKQAGFTNNVCTITSGTFEPPFIETAQCTTNTCFMIPQLGEMCFFSQFGGTLNLDAQDMTLGVAPQGIVTGGIGLFAGVAGSFAITSLVEEPFPTEVGQEIMNVLEVQFILTDYDPALALSGLF